MYLTHDEPPEPDPPRGAPDAAARPGSPSPSSRPSLALALLVTNAPAQADPRAVAKTPTAVGHRRRRRRRSTRTPPGSASTCCARAATPSTRRSRRPRRSASPSRTPPASAAAASSSTTTPRSAQVHTIDGRETAPQRMTAGLVPENGADPVRRGGDQRSVRRRARHAGDLGGGARPLGHAVAGQGAAGRHRQVANRGFVVDETFRAADGRQRGPLRRLHLDARALPARRRSRPWSASVFKNRDLAEHLRAARHRRASTGCTTAQLGDEIVDTVRSPPVAPGATRNVRPGLMDDRDLARYEAPLRAPTRVGYRGLDVYGMAPSSSGGSTVGEALNILEQRRPVAMSPHPGAAPLPRGERARLRRPRRATSATRPRCRRAARRSCSRRVRRRARSA